MVYFLLNDKIKQFSSQNRSVADFDCFYTYFKFEYRHNCSMVDLEYISL